MRSRKRQIVPHFLCLCVAFTVLHVSDLLAEEPGSNSRADEGGFFALPLELEADSGAANGNATIIRIAPLYGAPSRNNWKVVHLTQLVLADSPGGIPGQPGNPNPVAGERVFGLGDLMHGSFFTPPSSGNPVWGLGVMLNVPTATDKRLGSGKWSAGPAFRFVYRTGPWNFGLFGGQTWSFAGDDDRSDVSQLIVRGAVRRQLANDWYLVSAPIITANWKADKQKWLVPVGGGIGKVFRIGSNPWAFSLQGYYNVVKPNGAPDWSVRFAVIAAIPHARK